MPSIALPVSLRGQLLSGTGSSVVPPAFSPANLFVTGSQGIWLDPSDLTTMFSDRAGTTPVTTPGTVVGLRLDKSKGLTLGAELVVNGTFDSGTTGWTAYGSGAVLSYDAANKRAALTPSYFDQGITAPLTTVSGRSYRVSVTVTNGSTASRNFVFGFSTGSGPVLSDNATVLPGATRTIELLLVSGGVNTFTIRTASAFTPTAGEVYYYDNISVRELPGNHAQAPTDAARPIYGVEPKGGRRNLLTWSEGFDDSVWLKASAAGGSLATVSANAAASPTGTVTADLVTIARTATTMASFITQRLTDDGTVKTKSVYLKAFSGTDVGKVLDFWTFAGTVANRNAVTLTADWARVVLPPATLAAGANREQLALGFLDSGSLSPNTGTVQFLIWGAQLELGSTATNYQRVSTAYDITESGVATTHYVQYDGSDDSMSTAAIDFTATDKMSVFAGVRKLSDAARGMLAETGSAGTEAGSFGLNAPRDSTRPYLFTAGGTTLVSAQTTDLSFSGTVPQIVTGIADIAGDTNTLRINGAQVGQSTADQGSGNFGNYPLFIGRRNNATLPFNGRDYGIIIVGKAASAGEITDTETWLAARTSGVSI